MSWTGPGDIRRQMMKLWDRGVLLASMAGAESPFPRRLHLARPKSSELAERFTEVRDWISSLLRGEGHYRIEWRTVNHRTLGSNRVPAAIWVDSLDDGLVLIGRVGEAKRFSSQVEMTEERLPQLIPWLARRPLQALELYDDWQRLLDTVAWMRDHPQPGIYLRQVDIRGVDSKFIEGHRKVLAELFDLVLDNHQIDERARGVSGFSRRYGFLEKPVRVRFRILDAALRLLPTGISQDLAVTGETFAALELQPEKVYITENEINFLAFPQVAGSIVIFGSGYGFDTLARARWLQQSKLSYWGDIDTHGFAILDQLRTFFPEAHSLLMDEKTLLAHEAHWGMEPTPARGDLRRLTAPERKLYDDLCNQRFGKNVRLEQERIGFQWVRRSL